MAQQLSSGVGGGAVQGWGLGCKAKQLWYQQHVECMP